MDFLIVLMIVGTITGHLFGTDQAIKVGLNMMEYWLLAGLAITFLTPVFRLMGFSAALVTAVMRSTKWLFRKKP